MGSLRAAHFAHNPGAGDPDCELFGKSGGSDTLEPAFALRVSPLQLCIAEDESWQLYVEIPPIEINEWGGTEVGRYADSRVALTGDSAATSGMRTAGDLWPGSGRNTVRVAPTRTRAALKTESAWPSRVERRRWNRALPPLSTEGTIFAQYRGGRYRNYDPQTTPVQWGDTLILVTASAVKPESGTRVRRLDTRRTPDAEWFAWEVTLPAANAPRVRRWLEGCGVSVEGEGSRPILFSVPTGFGADDVPQFPPLSDVIVDPQQASAEIHLWHRERRYSAGEISGPEAVGLRSATPIDSIMVRSSSGRYLEYQLRDPVEAETHTWKVRCGGEEISPFGTLTLNAVPDDLEIDVGGLDPGPFFSAELDFGSETKRLIDADAASAQMWILERLPSARRLRIDSGNFGSIRVEIEPAAQEQAEDQQSPSEPRAWFDAYRRAVGVQGIAEVPHWRLDEFRQSAATVTAAAPMRRGER